MANVEIAGQQFAWIDLGAISVLVISMLIGVIRGLVFEIFSLLGWVVAYFGARWAAPPLALYLPIGAPGSAVNHVVAFGCAFVAVLIVWSLAVRLVRSLIRASPLSGFDRVLGAGFGFARGLLLLVAIATVVAWTPAKNSQAWHQSRARIWLNVVLDSLRPVLPTHISRHLSADIQTRTSPCAELLA
jgi:membrane protein required for colicin V production